MKPSERLNGIGEYYFSKKLREIDELNKAGKAIVSLGIGSPDLPPHPSVIDVLSKEARRADVHAYQSYKGTPVLRTAIAEWYNKWYGVSLNPDSEILPLIGSKEGIMHICMSFINPGDPVLVPDPGYPTYRSALQLAGGKPLAYKLTEENNWAPDFQEIEDSIRNAETRPRLMFVNYPHMPTGQAPDESLFEKLIAFAHANNLLIIHDNPYSFILNDNPRSLLAVEGSRELVIELNSLSKSHNMAGWRVGILAGSKAHVDEVMRFKSNMDSGMFLPLQLAAAKALQLGPEWFEDLNSIYRSRREKVFQLLDLLECRYSKKQVGMFVWAAVPDSYSDGYALSDEVLYNANVFITPGGIFGDAGTKYIRVSLCCPEERIVLAMDRVKEMQSVSSR